MMNKGTRNNNNHNEYFSFLFSLIMIMELKSTSLNSTQLLSTLICLLVQFKDTKLYFRFDSHTITKTKTTTKSKEKKELKYGSSLVYCIDEFGILKDQSKSSE